MVEKQGVPQQTSSQEPDTKPVLALLTDIMEEFRKQVQSKTPQPLEPAAILAVNAFKEISDALDVKPRASSTPQVIT
ncbi:MAG: hypothetical protein L0Y60_17945 [Beijerinckiaceae bacterium]|nr:hypothetical protein [Beijerinckiaceae bacterium]